MLHFDHRAGLALSVSDSAALKWLGEVVDQSAVSEGSRIPFTRILVNGLVPDPTVDLQLRIETPVGGWEDWDEIPLRVFENGRFWARLDVEEKPVASRLQFRVVKAGGIVPGTVEIFAVEVDGGSDFFAEEPLPQDRDESVTAPGKGSISRPVVISRQEWGAQQPTATLIAHDPYRMTQHHTAGRRIQSLEDGLAEMRFIQDFHQNGRGWQDIGYHYCVDDAGRIYEGVSPDHRGTHTGGANTGNIGISLFGNFDDAGEFPTAESLTGLEAVWSWLASHYQMNPDLLLGHRDYTATACPGANFYPELVRMRTGIRQALASGAPFVANPQPQPFSLEVVPESAIEFEITDAEEGVDLGSIGVRVNGSRVTPEIIGSPTGYFVSYQPEVSFPPSRTVIVEVEASDLAAFPHWMNYSYSFTIEVEAFHFEVESATSMRNAVLELDGAWSTDGEDVDLEGLVDGLRLVAVDDNAGHRARLFPTVESSGDYRVSMAVDGQFLGESAHYRFVNSAGREHPRLAEYNSVFDGQWASISPTPVHIDGGLQTEAFVEISGLIGLESHLILDAIRLERVDPLDPPSPPTLKWVRATSSPTNEVDIAWFPSLEGDIQGYRLFVSPDGRSWGEALVDETVLTADAAHYVVRVEPSWSTLYARLLAVDINGVEREDRSFEPFLSPWTDTYGARVGSGPRILIVDNFDRMASWALPYHSFVRSHGEAIAAHRLAFDSCTETAVQTGEVDLDDFDAVFYFCGDDSRADESLAAADQRRLLDYLRQGGRLFISGSEILYDFDATTSEEMDRIHDLLRADYGGDDSGSNRAFGVSGTPFEGLDLVFGTVDSDENYIEDYPDYVVPAAGSQAALTYSNARVAAVSFSGPFGVDNPEARLIYMAFPFESIVQAGDRSALIRRALAFFGFPHQAFNLPAFELD